MDWTYIALAACILILSAAAYLRIVLYFDDRWWNGLTTEEQAQIELEVGE